MDGPYFQLKQSSQFWWIHINQSWIFRVA